MFFGCRTDNKCLLSLSVAVGLAVTVLHVSLSAQCRRQVTVVLFIVGVVSVYCHRAANGSLMLPLLYTDNTVSQYVSIQQSLLLFL